MKGCGKSSDRHHFVVDLQIRGSGVSEDTTFLNRLAFHGLQIITGCGKAQDGVISRVAELQRIRRFSIDWHFTVDLQIKGCGKEQDGAIYFSRVAELFCTCSSFSHSLLIGQVLAFCNFIFVFHGTVCDWSKTLISKQLHFSFF